MVEQNANIPWEGWKCVKLIGSGGFGAVYEIERIQHGIAEKAAMKKISIPHSSDEIDTLRIEGYDDENITQRFSGFAEDIIQEYGMMVQMKGNANIVYCDDYKIIQQDDGFGWDIYIKMELLTPLVKALRQVAAEEQIVRFGIDMCNALEVCQKRNVIHRDIKPQNIFVSDDGIFKLGDFGIARTAEKTTRATVGIGTYQFMAPEVKNDQPYGSTVDIYSLGLVMYWILNGRRMPFLPLPPSVPTHREEELARQRRFTGEQIPAPRDGSAALKNIVLKACAFDPKDRYQTASEMREDLLRISGGYVLESQPKFIPDPESCPKYDFDDTETVGLSFASSLNGLDNGLNGAMTHIDTATVATDSVESQEDCKTTGPIFSDTQNANSTVPVEKDATVGPVFSIKATPRKEYAIEKHRSEAPHYAEPAKKPAILKNTVITIVIIVLIILFLLLRSCSKNNNHAIIAPSGSSQTPQNEEWSGWVDELPAGVSAEDYEIEEKTLYSSRTLETTSSTENSTMPGWELYDTVEANSEFGPWSEWSSTKVAASATREVDTQTRYRYRDKETTTSSSYNKDGWTKYDTTYSWGNYGSWSGWSTTAAYNSESRKVETKTQYRYRSISYSTEYTSWGSWSSWSFDRQSTSDLKKEESRTVWGYYYYPCPNCGAHMHGWDMYCPTWAGGCGKGWIERNMFRKVYSTTSWNSAGLKDWHGTGKSYAYVDGQLVFKWTSGGSGTQYRYATRSIQQVANYGSWSNWGDTTYSNTATRQVETRKVYRYCDRPQVATYHFYRWGAWSNWSVDKVSGTNDRQVENTPFYRYRDQIETKTYYFRRWTDWSTYSENSVTASDTREVQTKTQYRYKRKTK